MSTASLPSYVTSLLQRTPTYSAEPHEDEQRIALSNYRHHPSGVFIKQSRNGDACLRLTAQENGVAFPTYGLGSCVEGTVELSKTDGVTNIQVKIEGLLKLQEIAEGGTTSVNVCLDTEVLLPATFTYEDHTYPLPPTFGVKLSGLPGFIATIEYSVSAIVHKPNHVPSIVPLVKSSFLGIHIGTTTMTTPFIYYPRTRPAAPIPARLHLSRAGFIQTPEWRPHEGVIHSKAVGVEGILTRLFIPASSIFCISQPIPFHLTLESSSFALACFLPFSPTAKDISISKRATRIQLLRQSTVDVRNALPATVKTDMWRVDCIGEGTFRHTGDGPNRTSFSGEITIDESVSVTGFKAAGLSVKDCIVLSTTPPDPQKSSFSTFRLVIPVRLTTDPWTTDGTGIGIASRQQSE